MQYSVRHLSFSFGCFFFQGMSIIVVAAAAAARADTVTLRFHRISFIPQPTGLSSIFLRPD